MNINSSTFAFDTVNVLWRTVRIGLPVTFLLAVLFLGNLLKKNDHLKI